MIYDVQRWVKVLWLPVYIIIMKKIFAILSALITGGLGIALVSSVPQAAHAGLTNNWVKE